MRRRNVLAAGLACLLAACQQAVQVTSGAPTVPKRLAGLALVETPAAGRGDTLAIVYSGDGGWAAIDRGMAQGFARAGVPVVGVNSLRYFWTPRTPTAAAADLAAVIDHYASAWKRPRVILAGYSFGAGALPLIVAHLPARERAQVALMALVAVEPKGQLVFEPRTWFKLPPSGGYAVGPVLARLGALPRVCLFGAADPRSGCESFAPGTIRSIRLAGGHHFDGSYALISAAILRQARS